MEWDNILAVALVGWVGEWENIALVVAFPAVECTEAVLEPETAVPENTAVVAVTQFVVSADTEPAAAPRPVEQAHTEPAVRA